MPDFLPFLFVEQALYEGAPKVPAAIVLPVKVDGIDCYAQLDTGAPGAVIWHSKSKGDTPRKEVAVELAGMRRLAKADAASLALLEQGRCATGLIATVGNEFFEQGTLELDLAGARYRWQQGAALQGAPDAQAMRYVRWGGPGGHPLVTVRVAGGAPQAALLDTGSAAFGINGHSAQAWAGLTGGLRLHGEQRFSANSWGRQMPCVMGTVPRTLEIGDSIKLSSFAGAYCEGLGFKPDEALAGVIGLHHLLGKVLLIDYVSQRWAVRQP
ncbi:MULTISPECIES: hypothetical protein [unclassified Duganella]|uniref:hypothetical protein n=1 Tax=unclassified Duganella TaxID=2636909 RepID=UPI0006F8E645|nr:MULTISPECIES: hypothetical protein [unclassified Duganella]KQV53720.1 hypothetical protein ASD07_03975 [Duganella sp. Root336D2]KRB83725.1 hypothetical protein ASE26_11205 [Duganella sp. Root198D2]